MHTRFEFLSASTLALLAPVTPTAAPSASPSPEPALPSLHFDVAAFNSTLDVRVPHHHLFASTKLDGGVVLGAMRNTLNAYGDIGVPLSDVHPVAVFYHGLSVLLGFDDAMWDAYFIPLFAKPEHEDDAFAKDFKTVYDAKKRGNPCLHKQGGRDDTSIESLVTDASARFYVCNNAAVGFARYIARHLGKPPETVYTNLTEHLVPNTALVPAGVWAVHAIQERRYTLLQTPV